MTLKSECDGCGEESESTGEHKEVKVVVDGIPNKRHLCGDCYPDADVGEMNPLEFTNHVIDLITEE